MKTRTQYRTTPEGTRVQGKAMERLQARVHDYEKTLENVRKKGGNPAAFRKPGSMKKYLSASRGAK